MTFYCYVLYDASFSEFGLVQTHVNDDVAAFEFSRQVILSVIDDDLINLTDCDDLKNPFEWDGHSFSLNQDFLERFSLFRIGIFDTSTGLLDGSVERVNLFEKFVDALKSFGDYFNSLDCFKDLEVKDDEE